MLERVWRRGNPLALLIGMQFDTVTIRTVWRFLKKLNIELLSIQFISVTQSCPILCNSMDCSTPGVPVHYQLLELTQTLVHKELLYEPTIPLLGITIVVIRKPYFKKKQVPHCCIVALFTIAKKRKQLYCP